MQIETVKEIRGGGWLVNGSTSVPDDDANRHCRTVKKWIAAGNTPEPADPIPAVRALTYADFKARFTSAEMTAIRQAVIADTSGEALDWTLDAASANTVNLDSENCAAFLDKMIAAGILTEQRKTEILA